jgi:hypothetical protein
MQRKTYSIILRKICVKKIEQNLPAYIDMIMEEVEELPAIKNTSNPVKSYLDQIESNLEFDAGRECLVALSVLLNCSVSVWNINCVRTLLIEPENPTMSIDLLLHNVHYDIVTAIVPDPGTEVPEPFQKIRIEFGIPVLEKAETTG